MRVSIKWEAFMFARNKISFVTTVLTGGMLAWACGPVAADTLNGKVLGGGQPITNSTVTLWAASEGAPQQTGSHRSRWWFYDQFNSSGQRCHALPDREGRPTRSQSARW